MKWIFINEGSFLFRYRLMSLQLGLFLPFLTGEKAIFISMDNGDYGQSFAYEVD